MTPTSMIEPRQARARRGNRAVRIAALLAAALVAGCGQKGPLWVPGHAKNTPWPMSPAGTDTAAPAATAPAKPAGDAKSPAPQGAQ